MNKKKTLIISGIAALALAGAGATTAAARGWHSGLGHMFDDGAGHASERIASRIDRQLALSDEQEERVAAILAEMFTGMREIRDGREQGIAELIMSESISESDVILHLDHEAAVAEIKGLVAQAVVDVHSVLTPAQRESAGSLVGEAWGSWRGRGGHGHGHHGDRR